MNVIVALSHQFEQTPDGHVWSQTMFGWPFWKRYLSVFDNVRVVARMRPVNEPRPQAMAADGDGVTFIDLPAYRGPAQFVLRSAQIRRAIRQGLVGPEAVILRADCQIAACVERELRGSRPYGIEVVSDPYDVFAPGSVKHPLRPFFRWWFTRRLRRQCTKASAAAYVTRSVLQKRYPPAKDAFDTSYSNVELPDAAFVSAARRVRQGPQPLHIVSVGSMAQMYKGFDILIRAVAVCLTKGYDVRLSIIGDGRHRPQLEQQIQTLSLDEHVRLLGQLPAGQAVREQLDDADVFALVSRTEGLPRAMIEAMARALPCIGTSVGGIPELLPAEALVLVEDVDSLAARICALADDPERLEAMSKRNLAAAADYHDNMLGRRREEFYRAVKRATETWVRSTE